MLAITIIPDRTEFVPGESVTGHVEIKSDEEFKHNEIHLTFVCLEKSLFTKQVGKQTHVYSEERKHIEEHLIIRDKGISGPGDIRVPFQFEIPDLVPASYRGPCGSIQYTLQAHIERSWAKDPKDERTLQVCVPQESEQGTSRSDGVDHDGYPILEVQVEEDTFFLGAPIRGSYRIVQDTKMRGVRVDLIAKEQTRASGRNETRETIVCSIFTEEEKIPKNSWIPFEIPTNEFVFASFKTELITLEMFVRVAIDVPWRFDKVVDISVKSYYGSGTEGENDNQWGDFSF
ncbi:MAG: sporulation protein [Candidatus Thorarchaeota archaeon]